MTPGEVPLVKGIPTEKRRAEFLDQKRRLLHGGIISGQGRRDKGWVKNDKKR